ncbi:MAG: DUF4113 domain-containing protein, partial [Proteobacteria bacterium]
RDVIRVGAAGTDDSWKMNCGLKSRHFTTEWNDILKAK